MEVLKERIMLNGHFKNLSSFRFDSQFNRIEIIMTVTLYI
jgi:hypothetical protein